MAITTENFLYKRTLSAVIRQDEKIRFKTRIFLQYTSRFQLETSIKLPIKFNFIERQIIHTCKHSHLAWINLKNFKLYLFSLLI